MLALFPFDPATHPPQPHPQKKLEYSQLSLNSTQSQHNSISDVSFISATHPHPQKNLEYSQAQPQLNSISTQTTELGTTQLKLVPSFFLSLFLSFFVSS